MTCDRESTKVLAICKSKFPFGNLSHFTASGAKRSNAHGNIGTKDGNPWSATQQLANLQGHQFKNEQEWFMNTLRRQQRQSWYLGYRVFMLQVNHVYIYIYIVYMVPCPVLPPPPMVWSPPSPPPPYLFPVVVVLLLLPLLLLPSPYY